MADRPVWIKGRPGITSGFVRVKHPPGAVDLEDWAKADYAMEQVERVAAEEANRTSPRGRRARPETRGKAMLLALDVSALIRAGEPEKGAVHRAMIDRNASRSAVYAAVRQFPNFFALIEDKNGRMRDPLRRRNRK
jgi:hypothetical protein